MTAMPRNGHTSTHVSAIKNAARGRWPEILPALAGISPHILDGKHYPCFRCGGTDRFRAFDDFQETGGVYCNQCHAEQNSDGISTLQWAAGIDFKAAVKMLADHLGIKGNGHANSKTPAGKKYLLKQVETINLDETTKRNLLQQYCDAKPPITIDGIHECGGKLVRWNRIRCIASPGYTTAGDKGNLSAIVLCRVDGKPFPPTKKLGERKTHTVGGSVNSWLCSGTAEQVVRAETIIDVEGLTDLLAAVSAGIPSGWVAVTNTAGAKARGKLSCEWAKGKRIIVPGDADEPGQEGQRRAAAAYVQAEAAEVLLAQLPYPVEKDHGRDLRDWILEGKTIVDLPTAAVTAEQAVQWQAKKPSSRKSAEKEIVVGTDESRVIDEAIEALATRENVHQRGGCLVHIVEGTEPPLGIARPKEAPRIATMRFARIRELLADAAVWLRPAGEGEMERIHPPDWVVKGIDARGQWSGIRRLEAVVESPVLRTDGTVLQTPGYDPLTGIVFRPQCNFPEIPNKPTRDCAVRARDALLEVVEDFPFAGDTHRAAWLAGVLTPLARLAFHGPAPLFLNDANVRGCGKSLSTDATSIITAGREMARMSMPRDDDEFRKRITALAVAGEPLILIDNIAGAFGSPSLDAALTATSWSDRILGQTAMATAVPLYAVWYGTGNNVVLVGDTARRVVHIRLESPLENPEERADFRHTDLLAWVREERPRLTAAAVTVLAAFCAAGRPDMRLTPWGSFEGWSNLVRQAVAWIGLPDPGATRAELTTQADREAVALRQLIAGWEEIDTVGVGMTVAAALRELAEYPTRYDTLRAALSELAPPRDGKTLNPRSVGMKLHHLRRRVVGGKFLDRREARQGAIWVVCGRDTCGTSATSGTSLDSARTGAHTHTRENLEGAENSPASPVSPTPDPADCFHDWVDTNNGDGRTKRTCRLCGEFYGYMQEAQQ